MTAKTNTAAKNEAIKDALVNARAVLGDRVRDGSASTEEIEAYEEAKEALKDS
jgi:hypothetical protein